MTAHPLDLERTYTADEFETLPEFGQRYELVAGKLVRKPMPNQEHSLIARLLIRLYDRYDREEKVGSILQESSVTLNQANTPFRMCRFGLLPVSPRVARRPRRNPI